METTRTFEEVKAWQKAHKFILMVYQTTHNFPEFERFGLSSQFQRAAVSIAANIAEGYGKLTQPDKLRFLVLLKVAWKNVDITVYLQRIYHILI